MNGLWKLATDAAGQASALGAQAAEAVSPHVNSALNAAKSVQISEEQINSAKRAAQVVGGVSAGAAGTAGTALAAHANNVFNAIKSVHIPKEHLDAAAMFANQAAAGMGKVAADVQQHIASLDPDVKRKAVFVGGGIAVVVPPLVLGALGFTPGGVAAGSAAGMQAGIGNVAAGSVFAGWQSAGVVGFGPGVYAAAAGLVCTAGHLLDEWTKKMDSKL
ncbi:hypothetical protein B0H13DRAFT_2066031 [Mycena leptocephala]|nr:hypothetical protein B0H13DRAFT_2066031 [Mycena leptocephala]